MFSVLNYAFVASSTMLTSLTLVLLHVHYDKTRIYNGADLLCSQGVGLHCVYTLVGRMLSLSSLFFLQQPMLNVRSFYRCYQFLINGQAGGPADEDGDSCIRHHAAEGLLLRALLFEDCSPLLLGLAPY